MRAENFCLRWSIHRRAKSDWYNCVILIYGRAARKLIRAEGLFHRLLCVVWQRNIRISFHGIPAKSESFPISRSPPTIYIVPYFGFRERPTGLPQEDRMTKDVFLVDFFSGQRRPGQIINTDTLVKSP